MKILIVDNEPNICRALKFALGKDHDVLVCHNTLHALQLIQQGLFDLLILDFNMDILNGSDILKILKQKHTHLQTIILSSRTFKQEEIKKYRLDIYPIISKDNSLQHIINEINSYALNHSIKN